MLLEYGQVVSEGQDVQVPVTTDTPLPVVSPMDAYPLRVIKVSVLKVTTAHNTHAVNDLIREHVLFNQVNYEIRQEWQKLSATGEPLGLPFEYFSANPIDLTKVQLVY